VTYRAAKQMKSGRIVDDQLRGIHAWLYLCCFVGSVTVRRIAWSFSLLDLKFMEHLALRFMRTQARACQKLRSQLQSSG
jgi:hypothetical protein